MRARAIVAIGCLALALAHPVQAEEGKQDSGVVVSTFAVEGMHCGGCAVNIRLAVRELDGVQDVKVVHNYHKVVVRYESTKVTPDEIIEAIEKQGFGAELEKTEDAGPPDQGPEEGGDSSRLVGGLP